MAGEKKATILVVDDDETVLIALSEQLHCED